MTRRTRCFTYGETTRRECMRTINGVVTLATYVTACGRSDVEDVDGVPRAPVEGPRPRGTCPRCWASWRMAHLPVEP